MMGFFEGGSRQTTETYSSAISVSSVVLFTPTRCHDNLRFARSNQSTTSQRPGYTGSPGHRKRQIMNRARCKISENLRFKRLAIPANLLGTLNPDTTTKLSGETAFELTHNHRIIPATTCKHPEARHGNTALFNKTETLNNAICRKRFERCTGILQGKCIKRSNQ